MGDMPRSGLVGRDSELAGLSAFLSQPERFPRALILEGEPGIGKTSVWRSALESIDDRSIRVLSCTPGPAETQISFGALADLLEDVRETLPRLPRPQERALRIALLLEEPEDPPADPRATFTAVLSVIREVATTTPLVVAIDDAHFLDAGSAAALAFLMRRLGDTPIAFLLSFRSGQPREFIEHVERSFGEDRFERVQLGPLSLAAFYRLLQDRLPTSFARPTLRRIHTESRGNPLLALEIGRALGERGGEILATERLPVPTEIRELLTARLDALPIATREALLPVSAMAEPTLGSLESTIGPAARAQLRPAFEAHIVEWDEERIRFTHPLLSSTVYANTGPSERRAVHARLAEVVRLPEERARHLASAVVGTDATVAGAVDEAAHRLAARGLPGEAADLLEMSVGLTPAAASVERRRRKTAAAMYHFTGGRVGRSRELLEGVLEALEPGPERAQVLLGLAQTEDQLPIAGQRCEQALIEAAHDPRTRAAAEHLASIVCLALGLSVPAAKRHAESAVRAAEEASDLPLLAQALSATVLTRTLAGDPVDEETVQRGLALEDELENIPMYYPPSLSLAHRLSFTERRDDARSRFEQTSRRAADTGDEVMQAGVLLHWSELECRVGEFRRAAQLGQEGYEITQQLGFESRQTPLLYVYAMAQARLGRTDEARGLATRAEASGERYGMRIWRDLARSVLGSLELSLGDPHAAAHHLASIPDHLRRAGFGEPGVCMATPDAVEALTAVGRLEEARAVLAWLEQRSRVTGSLWGRAVAVRCEGVLAAAQGDVDMALERLESALELQGELAQPYEEARTLLALGTTLRRARHRRDAREVLTRAVDLFHQVEARSWEERARSELGRIGGRAPSPTALTPSEQRVADLVARGLTNAEIAAELVISIYTVETHLSRAYAKLGVRSRTELTRRILSGSGDRPPASEDRPPAS